MLDELQAVRVSCHVYVCVYVCVCECVQAPRADHAWALGRLVGQSHARARRTPIGQRSARDRAGRTYASSKPKRRKLAIGVKNAKKNAKL